MKTRRTAEVEEAEVDVVAEEGGTERGEIAERVVENEGMTVRGGHDTTRMTVTDHPECRTMVRARQMTVKGGQEVTGDQGMEVEATTGAEDELDTVEPTEHSTDTLATHELVSDPKTRGTVAVPTTGALPLRNLLVAMPGMLLLLPVEMMPGTLLLNKLMPHPVDLTTLREPEMHPVDLML